MVYMGSKNKLSKYLKPLFYNTHFEYSDYRDLDLKNAVIYCDPPYHNTTTYTINNKVNKFNYDEFLKKCEQWYRFIVRELCS